MEKKTEQLQAAAEKAAQALQAVSEKLEAAQKELAEKPEDEKLKKKAEGLTAAVEAAKQKLDAAQTALKEAEKSGDDESTAGSSGTGAENADKKVRLKVRNKTGRPTYYRAGLCFTQADAEYEVAKGVADILLADPWLIAEEVK
ncbi:hypothetical protein [Treponema socranskii]|uniref:hypothetical protein n=1 Tax=Treponema socranskii TaxID=53419 RepID=UPI003D9184DA